MEIEMLQEHYPERMWDNLERLFVRAANWWQEYDEWGDYPLEGPRYEQPKEWLDSVSCVRAAKNHYQMWVKTPPQQIGSADGEGGIGRGAVGE